MYACLKHELDEVLHPKSSAPAILKDPFPINYGVCYHMKTCKNIFSFSTGITFWMSGKQCCIGG